MTVPLNRQMRSTWDRLWCCDITNTQSLSSSSPYTQLGPMSLRSEPNVPLHLSSSYRDPGWQNHHFLGILSITLENRRMRKTMRWILNVPPGDDIVSLPLAFPQPTKVRCSLQPYHTPRKQTWFQQHNQGRLQIPLLMASLLPPPHLQQYFPQPFNKHTEVLSQCRQEGSNTNEGLAYT